MTSPSDPPPVPSLSEPGLADQITSAAVNAAKEAATAHIQGPVFQATLNAELKAMLKDAEVKTRWFVGIAGGLVFAIFLILLTIKYLDVREKQVEIYQQYVEAAKLIDEIKKTTATLAIDVDTPKKAAEATSQEMIKILDLTKRNLDDVWGKINTAKGELNATQGGYDQRVKHLDTLATNLAQTRSDLDQEVQQAVRSATSHCDDRIKQFEEKMISPLSFSPSASPSKP